MNGDTLGAELLAAIDAAVAEHGPANRAELFKALGNAIVAHITTNAAVNVSVTSVGGVTAGVGTSGPGAGTGTIS